MAESLSQPERSVMLHSQMRDIFVGRQRELAELTVALDDALASHGRLVMLAGEPGIGNRTEAARYASQHGLAE